MLKVFGFIKLSTTCDKNINLKKNQFNGFICMSFMEHAPDINKFLRSINKILKDESFGIIEVPNFNMILKKKLYTEFIRDHRFNAIMLMASYPNATFDICGIACGYYRIPFLEFLSATVIGKAFIKAPLQAIFTVFWFLPKVDEYKDESSVIAYWNYYVGEKHTVAGKDEKIYKEIPWVELVGF